MPAESADKSTIIANVGTLTDAKGSSYRIDTAGKVWMKRPTDNAFVPDAVTNGAVRAAILNHTIYHQNAQGNWYKSSGNIGGWSHQTDAALVASLNVLFDATPPPPPPPPTDDTAAQIAALNAQVASLKETLLDFQAWRDKVVPDLQAAVSGAPK